MKELTAKQSIFGLRLSPGEAIQLDAISRSLRITKSDVLRLSLSSQSSLKPSSQGAGNEVIAEALDAVSGRIRTLDDRLEGVESMLSSAVDLLLSLSRNMKPDDRHPERHPERQPEPQTRPEPAKIAATPALPGWAAFQIKHFKISPIMSDEQWVDFLKGKYEKDFKQPPDLSS